MRLHILSDLHEEFGRTNIAPADADMVILAGDISVGLKGVEVAKRIAAGRPLIYVAGNHEYYGGAIPHLTEKLRTACATAKIHFLEREAVVINGVRFLGCTLWTDFRLLGSSMVIASALACVATLNDFKKIRISPEFRGFTPKDASIEHTISVSWLRRKLEAKTLPTVVITHHAPLQQCIHQSQRDSLISGAYASDLSDLIQRQGPHLWVYGHTHVPADFVIGSTRVISNPRGYPDAKIAGFDAGKIVEVGASNG
jgi:predicted phosphodiesterase